MNDSPPLDFAELLLLALAAAVAVMAARWWWRRVWLPGRTLRTAIRGLADGRTPDAAALLAVKGPWREVAGDLARAGERVRGMVSQLDDETLNLRTILES